jgi:dehydrogenase/reductase SDR family member 12
MPIRPVPASIAGFVDGALEATTVLSYTRVGYAVRSRLEGWDAPGELDGVGRRVVITGATSGLGEATAALALAAGAHTHLLGRSAARVEATRTRLVRALGSDAAGRISHDIVDLTDLTSVRGAAQRLVDAGAPVHALVHNAGATFDRAERTVDGLERTYQLHVAAPFLLTALLLARLAASAPARVLTVSSGGMYTQRLSVDRLVDPGPMYRPTVAYAQAKRAQVELTTACARVATHHGIEALVAHPGWADTPGVRTSLPRFRRLMGPLLRDPAEGADTIAWLLLARLPAARSQRIWHDRRARAVHRLPTTRASRGEVARLWRRVCHDVGLDQTACPAPVQDA